MENAFLLLYIVLIIAFAAYSQYKNTSFIEFAARHSEVLLAGLFLTAGLAIRFHLFSFESVDYRDAFLPWYKQLGGLRGMREFATITDYTPSYVYLLAFLAEFNLSPLLGMKAVSVMFDVALATGVWLIAREITDRTSLLPVLCAGAVFMCPTVFSNSAFWGQCDVIYATFIVFSFLAVIRQKYLWAVFLWGAAFAFKIQSIFILIPFLVLFLQGQIKTTQFLLLPVAYIVMGIPAFLLGAPLADVALVYIKQAGNYPTYALNAPSAYAMLVGVPWMESLKSAGITLAMFAGVFISLMVVFSKKNLTQTQLVLLMFLSVLLFPFILPKMHERYFYLADVFSILFAFCYRKYWYIPIFVVFASYCGYYPFLFGIELIDMKFAALLIFIALLIVLHLTYKELSSTQTAAGEES